jgi:phenylalanyl-tRNA synthetase beta chain
MAQERAKVPVVNMKFKRLKRLVSGGISMNKVLDILPFIGVDIEDVSKDGIRVEYNPNRPDFSSDYGVIRALRGLLGIETGLPKFRLAGRSGLAVNIEDAAVLKKIRPYLIALVAKNGTLDDETLKQLIVMQEDLHNGVGRKRRKASIGIHNLDVIKFPVTYKTVSGDYSFTPLDESSEFRVDHILRDLEIGKQYGHILSAFDRYPLIVDSVGTVLSFPPIINSQATKVNDKCHNLFVEVTATDQETAEDVLAILAMTLYDAGFEIKTVSIVNSGRNKKKIETPQMKTKVISADISYVNSTLGLTLDTKQIITCLKKSRLDAKAAEGRKKILCTIPRYRIDISNPIDISEEVAIGYGVYNFEPKFPTSPTAGKKDFVSVYFNTIRDGMIGLGMIESLNFMLTSKEVQYGAFGIIPAKGVLSVDSSKSTEHEILRDSLVPLLLQSLSYNIHEQYPQRLFEIGKTFLKSSSTIEERWSIGAVIAHTDASYTEAKSTMQALLRSCFGKEATTKASTNYKFMEGRCAEVIFDGKSIGVLGEIIPRALENFKLRTPVAAFELNLLAIIKEDKYSTI